MARLPAALVAAQDAAVILDAPPRVDGDRPRRRSAARHRPRLVINGRFAVQEVTGVQRVAHEIVREIDLMIERGELDADVVLLCPPGRKVQPLDFRHIEVRTVGRLRGVWWEQFVLPRHVAGATLLCLGNSAPVATLLGKTPVSVMIHDVSFINHPDAYRLRYRLGHRLMLPLLVCGADRLFTVSETERRRIAAIRWCRNREIVVAPNGGWSDGGLVPGQVQGGRNRARRRLPAQDRARSSIRADLPERCILPERYILYVGSLSHRKNFDRTLAAAIRLAREDGLDFVFVGCAGKVLRPPSQTVPADVAGKIHFMGQVNDRALLGRIYAGASLLLFPSLYEASPLPPLEAAHFDCPVVASNIPSIWERCGQGVAYCNPRSLDSIVATVRSVLADGGLRQALAGRMAAIAAGRTWAAQARTLCTAILGSGPEDSELPEPRSRISAVAG